MRTTQGGNILVCPVPALSGAVPMFGKGAHRENPLAAPLRAFVEKGRKMAWESEERQAAPSQSWTGASNRGYPLP